MNQNDLAARRAFRLLGMDQDADIRLGLIEFRFDREALLDERARPEVPRDGQQVSVPKQRLKGLQTAILAWQVARVLLPQEWRPPEPATAIV